MYRVNSNALEGDVPGPATAPPPRRTANVAASSDRAAEDADTCRICRGEGTADEPLFYPCKCSGSIKYVHQECLMEWLSHSQKKYCELCKTSFRFTKLYHPGMPNSIPTSIFIRRAALHVLSMFMTWCRALLVASVWLILLPWCMRVVWRSLFWVGDGGWTREETGSQSPPSQSRLPETSSFWPFYVEIFLLGRHQEIPRKVPANTTASNHTTVDYLRSPSLLSDITFLHWFKSQAANRFVLDVFEGQIITLLVVVAFILIFLIREWVVQQQPVINMVALGDNAIAQQAQMQDEHNNANEEVDSEEEEEDGQEEEQVVEEEEDDEPTNDDRLARPDLDDAPRQPMPSSRRSSAAIEDTQEESAESSPSQRPVMPARDQSSVAAEIRRGLEENHTWSFADVPQSQGDTRKPEPNSVPDSWEDGGTEHAATGGADLNTTEQDPGSDNSSESWQQIPETMVDNPEQKASGEGKGKAKAVEPGLDDSTDILPAHSEAQFHPPLAPHLEPPAAESNDTPTDASECGSDSYRDTFETDNEEATGEQPAELIREPSPTTPERIDENRQHGLPPNRNFRERILDWVYRDVAQGVPAQEDVADDEVVVQVLADFEHFDQIAARGNERAANAPIQDPEVAAAAAQAGIDVNDQDAIDDAEDLEGIMELIGMQGPLTGLFQNAMFSAVLISATLACAVWLPYLWGKVVILFMGSPVALFVKLPLQIIATLADLFVDGALCITAGLVYGTLQVASIIIKVCTLNYMNRFTERPIGLLTAPAYNIANNAAIRLGNLIADSPLLPPPTYFRLSMNSHVALRTIQNMTSHTLNQTSSMVTTLCEEFPVESASKAAIHALRQMPATVQSATAAIYNKSTEMLSWLLTTKSYKITLDLDLGHNVSFAYAALEHWTATDRLIAVLAGYGFFALAGAIYLKRSTPLTSSQQGQKVERILSEVLQQAGGVLKVILIISIEMLIFPLYCGLLLDMALLPLFKDASLYTRWQFTRESPWTAGFVHWFIGTCYMFHFALFVSMCRKILRKGVLYFIRDPDDPTFHPVRDVLERSVTTQLRKIAFSGLVYGGLVIVCLGGVVWILDQATVDVLPIHWVSHAPSLEFPLDLLFYNFLTPVVIKFYKPSDGLHAVSKWWFKICARFLRMSNFLFGDKNGDEEGRKVNGEMVFEGKYVRAPASDQVRIPKGDPVFVEVDKDNVRKDGNNEGGGVHNSSNLVTKVYIPPWFRVRIALFVFTIWIFAAITGISVTIIPLIFGRYLFSLFLPKHIEMNDIHAFSLGIYTLGSMVYTLYQAYKFISSLHPIPSPLATLYNISHTTLRVSLHALRFAYVWTSLILLIPLLFAILIELYLLMPLHAYFGPSEPHVIHVIQDWTLGFLYARLAARIIFSNRASRPARAFSAVIADGYMNPNAQITTRCFLLPTLALFLVAISFPALFAVVTMKTILWGASDVVKAQVWRFCYPALGLAGAAVWAAKEGVGVVGRWRMVVRDEVYLIGERLHNFGERRVRVGRGREAETEAEVEVEVGRAGGA
ncbi:hypothetical protein CC80DRAFT_469686 [Byssothecium circinans]|uniref:RING-type E3 ubiquitin transferase n=1 Tax=Byssothecium circinans TaxID=147558 RepID=A0A6A5U437_9PLEO|nr:hypothetical protein CC80DRAFT_469686 [Byssothecium circinans]